jgi:EamA domain-containing membrane protein RarD
MLMRGTLIAIGTLLMLVAMVFIIWGMVEVAQGDKGTWEIWPFYVIHGTIAMTAMVLYAVANRGRPLPVKAKEAEEVEET